MSTYNLTLQKIVTKSSPLRLSLEAFLLSRKAMRCTPKTLEAYTYALTGFLRFLEGQGVADVRDITAHHIRAYLVGLQERGLKDTTQHLHARCVKTFMRWLYAEGEIPTNPMQKVVMPRLEKRIPPPFTPEDIRCLLEACNRQTPKGLRDYAIVLGLLDTGLRAAEFLSLRVGDVNMRTGLVTVMGKGRKMRTVRLGAKARQAVLRYLAALGEADPSAPLWVAFDVNGNPVGALTKRGLQTMLHRLGHKAGVMPCSPHRFRRTFALWCLRDGMDIYSLRSLMGHSDLTVLQRYLALAGEDIERAHSAHSPVDNLLEGHQTR